MAVNRRRDAAIAIPGPPPCSASWPTSGFCRRSQAEAARILAALVPRSPAAGYSDPLTDAVAVALRGHGWEVETRVGASRFRGDLAGDCANRIGILLDHEATIAG